MGWRANALNGAAHTACQAISNVTYVQVPIERYNLSKEELHGCFAEDGYHPSNYCAKKWGVLMANDLLKKYNSI